MTVDRSLVNYNETTRKGQLPLLTASLGGHKAVVDLLLKLNCIKVDAKDRWGRTALAYSALRGNNSMVRVLFGAGADVNEVGNFGGRIVLNAISRHSDRTLHLLVNMPGLRPDIPDFRGITPLREQ